MDDQQGNRVRGGMPTGSRRVAGLVLCILVLAILPFIPLVLALMEFTLFKTEYSTRVWRQLGIFEPLGEFYAWLGLISN
jgi:hypothetical protein